MNFRFWKRVPSAREERDVWLKWLVLNGFSVKTAEGYKTTTDKLLAKYPRTPLAKFNEHHITELCEEQDPRSRQRTRSAFTNWFRWAYKTRRIKTNPMDHVPTYRQPEQEHPEVFTEAECKLLAALPSPDGVLCDLLLSSGMRKSEARHLTVRRIDFEHGELHVVEGAKGNHPRVVPLVGEILQRVSEYVLLEGLNDSDHLWYCHPGGSDARYHDRPISESAIHKWWQRCVEYAGVPYRNMHATRHTFATAWRRRGLDMADVGRALGHRDLKTTYQVYVHTTSFDLRRRMEALL